jgi:hypothetical protein
MSVSAGHEREVRQLRVARRPAARGDPALAQDNGREMFQMRYRISFLSGLVAGYVLGARAGRERYEQIKRIGRAVADSPAAQQAAGAVQAQAAGLAKTARQRVTDELHDRMPKVAENVPGLRQRNGDSQPPGRKPDATATSGNSGSNGTSA